MHAILPLMVLSALAAAPQFDVQLLDGSRVSGSLVRWDAAQLVVETSTGRTTLDAGKLASVTPQSPPASPAAKPAVWVDLVDGSQLAAAEYTAEKGRAKIAFSATEVLEVPTAEIDAVRLQPASEATALEWSRIRGKKIRGDVLVTGNSNAIDYHQGAIEDVSDAEGPLHPRRPGLGRQAGEDLRPDLFPRHGGLHAGVPLYDRRFGRLALGGRLAEAQRRQDRFHLARRPHDPPRARSDRQDRPLLRQDRLPERFETRLRRPSRPIPSPSPEKNSPAAWSSRGSAATRISNRSRCESTGRSTARDWPFAAAASWPGPCPASSAAWRGWPASTTTSARWAMSACRSSATARRCWTRALPATRRPKKDPRPISLDVSGVRRLVLIVESQGNFGTADHLDLGNLRLIK